MIKNKSIFSFLKNINPDVLKLVALITMTIDHIGHVLVPSAIWMRDIGRVTFPLFAYLFCTHLAEKSLFKKYAKRLFPFAVITTILISPLNLLFQGYINLNIFWVFLLALTVIKLFDVMIHSKIVVNRLLCGLIILPLSLLSLVMDYNVFGFIFVVGLYGWIKAKSAICLSFGLVSAFLMNYSSDSITSTIYASISLMAVVFLLWQRSSVPTPHKRFLKPWWVFYLYYPVHFFILYVILYFYVITK